MVANNVSHPFVSTLVQSLIPNLGYGEELAERAELERQLLHFIEVESQGNHVSNIFRTFANALARTYDNSDWCRMKKALKTRAMPAIADHYNREEKISTLELKADALSEFILRYLVTLESVRNPEKKGPKYIDEREWNSERMDTLSVSEVIERSIRGHGYHLPPYEVVDLIQLIRVDKIKIQSTLKMLESIVEQKEANAVLFKKNPEVYAIASLALNHLSEYIAEFQIPLQQLAWVDTVQPKTFPGRRDKLEQIFRQVREKIDEVERVRKLWMTSLQILENEAISAGKSRAVIENLCIFGRLRLKSMLDYLDEVVKKHPEPTYVNEGGSESIIIEAYTPHAVRELIKVEGALYQKSRWVEEVRGEPEKKEYAATLAQIYQSIKAIEATAGEVRRELSRPDAREYINTI